MTKVTDPAATTKAAPGPTPRHAAPTKARTKTGPAKKKARPTRKIPERSKTDTILGRLAGSLSQGLYLAGDQQARVGDFVSKERGRGARLPAGEIDRARNGAAKGQRKLPFFFRYVAG